MRVNFKSILSLSIMAAFIIFPCFAISFNYKEDKNIKTTETKDINVKEAEITKKKVKDIKKKKEVPTEKPVGKTKKSEVKATDTPKKNTSKPTANASAKSTKKVKRVSKVKQKTQSNKRTFYLSSYERRVVECIVMGESGGESYRGQVMVAFCILNACKKDGLQPSQVRKAYKYSGWKENPNKSVKKAVSAVFDNGYKPVNDKPLYFYAPNRCNSSWHETQRYITTIGGHKFFGRW